VPDDGTVVRLGELAKGNLDDNAQSP